MPHQKWQHLVHAIALAIQPEPNFACRSICYPVCKLLMLNRYILASAAGSIFTVLSTVVVCAVTAQQVLPNTHGQIAFSRWEMRIHMEASGKAGLQTFLLMPSTTGKHPLVLMTHGTDFSNGRNKEIGPGMLQPEALWFARRGWAVAIVVRRGYGESGGEMDKKQYGCRESDFENIARQDAADFQAAYDYLVTWPDIDADEVIVVGSSTGGFAAVAFGAQAPAGLKAVINFAGGWHSLFFAGSCAKSGLVPAFHQLGGKSRGPALWIYAKNDGLFGPKYVTEIYRAFTSAGGTAELETVDRSGEDGHYLFSESPQLWGPIVQKFLTKLGLPSAPLYPDPPVPSLKLPVGFSYEAQKAFASFLTRGPCKAFAAGPNGAWSYSSGKKTLKVAVDDALERCGSQGCIIIAKDPQCP